LEKWIRTQIFIPTGYRRSFQNRGLKSSHQNQNSRTPAIVDGAGGVSASCRDPTGATDAYKISGQAFVGKGGEE